jgi:hypothetical protein
MRVEQTSDIQPLGILRCSHTAMPVVDASHPRLQFGLTRAYSLDANDAARTGGPVSACIDRAIQ